MSCSMSGHFGEDCVIVDDDNYSKPQIGWNPGAGQMNANRFLASRSMFSMTLNVALEASPDVGERQFGP